VPIVVKPASSGRIESLTGLRMLAAGAVFLSHAALIESVPQTAQYFMAAGYNGVTLFFVLSGFVLAWNYSDRLSSPRPRALWSFFVARFARVYPLYLVALFIVIARPLEKGQVDQTVWLHVFALQPWEPSVLQAFAYNRPGWSIGVEFFLYACFPLVIVVLSRFGHRLLIWALAIAVALVFLVTLWFVLTGRGDLPATDPQSAHRWLYRTPVSRLGDFTAGVILALLIMRGPSVPPWAARTAQLVGALGFIGLMAYRPLIYTAWSWDAAYLVPTLLLLWGLAAGPKTPFSRVLASRPMVLLGESSFAFYLLHTFVIDLMPVSTTASLGAWALVLSAQFLVAVLISIGAHIAIERPAQRWMRSALDPRKRASEPLVSDVATVEALSAPDARVEALDVVQVPADDVDVAPPHNLRKRDEMRRGDRKRS
jgi:peptidoglycan/LPS O-acetylase OafA/YrhL